MAENLTPNGYHIFSRCGKDPQIIAAYSELRGELGEGYSKQSRFGSAAGTKRWTVPMPTLSGGSGSEVITFRGRDYNHAQYVRALFDWQKRTGEPFAFLCPENDNYYLAEFAESEQSFTKKLAALYETSLNIRQVRRSGAFVLDLARMKGVARYYQADYFAETYADNDTIVSNWEQSSGGGLPTILGINGNPTFQTNEQNSKPVVRLDGTDDYFGNGADLNVKEAFVVCKYRGAAFSNYAGLLTGIANDSASALIGDSGQTRFFNNSYASGLKFTYELNGVEHPQTNMLAPMEKFGLVRFRIESGLAFDGLQIGKDRSQPGRFGAWDIGEIVVCDALLSERDAAELTEYLMNKWRLGA